MSRTVSGPPPPAPQPVTLFDLGSTSGLPDAVRAFRLILAAGQLLRTRMDARLRPDDGPSVSDVAALIGSTRQNVTQLVTALQRKGMLRVDDDPSDSRRRVLTTTRLSDTYWEQRNAGDYAALESWFEMLDHQELRGLCEVLQRVVSGRQSDG